MIGETRQQVRIDLGQEPKSGAQCQRHRRAARREQKKDGYREEGQLEIEDEYAGQLGRRNQENRRSNRRERIAVKGDKGLVVRRNRDDTPAERDDQNGRDACKQIVEIDLPRAPPDGAQQSGDGVALENARIDDAAGQAREEDEDLGGVGEAEPRVGKPA